MKNIKSDFIKNLNKLIKKRKVSGGLLDSISFFLSNNVSGFFPVTEADCDVLLLLSSYPVSEQIGPFRIENSLLYACKSRHPILNELFDYLGFDGEFRATFFDLINKYNLHSLEYFNFFRNAKDHDDLSYFSKGSISKKCFLIADKSKFGSVVSHPAKMTHPACKMPRIFFNDGQQDNDGFLRSGNVNVDFDLHINATQLVVFKFLSLPYKEGCLLDCVKGGDLDSFSEIFSFNAADAERLVSEFSTCVSSQDYQTNDSIRQVYFPTSTGYHLLSILKPSGLVFSLKKKVDWINNHSPNSYLGKKARKKDEFFGNGYQQVINLTETKHGGDHPKNISGLNNKYQSYYLLASMPPELSLRSVRLPTRNFFSDVLYPKQLQETFQAFHRLLITDYNNVNIRDGRDYRIQEYLDQLILKMWQVRKTFEEQRHARPDRLEAYQKLWLFPEHEEERTKEAPWLKELIKDATRNFISSYQKVLGKSAIQLGDTELEAFTRIIEQNKEALI